MAIQRLLISQFRSHIQVGKETVEIIKIVKNRAKVFALNET